MFWFLITLAFFLVVIWLTWQRVLALVVVAVARRKKLQLQMDAFTLTAASGVVLKLHKGPVGELAVREARLGWGTDARGSGFLSFLLRGPKVRISLSGIRLKLAAASPAETALSGPPPAAAREESATPLFLLQALVVEMDDVTILDQNCEVLGAIQKCTLSGASHLQTLAVSGICLMPQQEAAPPLVPEDLNAGEIAAAALAELPCLLKLDQFKLQHEGPLSALRRRGGQPHRVSFQAGNTSVFLPVELQQRAAALVRNRPHKQRPSSPTEQAPPAGPGIASKLQGLPKESNVQFARIEVVASTSQGLKIRSAVEGATAAVTAPPLSPSDGSSSASLAAAWQKFSFTLAGGDDTPPALELQCSTSELVLAATPANRPAAPVGPLAAAAAPPTELELDCRVAINAMHTSVRHWSLEDIVNRLPPIRKISPLSGQKTGATSPRPGQHILAAWKFSSKLGEGSSMRFLDRDCECTWLSSLASAELAVDSTGGAALSQGMEATRTALLDSLGVSFQATSIAMMTANLGSQAIRSLGLEKVLSAELVRFGWQPGAGDIATVKVHAVMHPSSVGTLADVANAVLPLVPGKNRALKSVRRVAEAKPLVRCADATPRRPPPLLTFSFDETFFLAPTTVTVSNAHSSIGRLQLVHGTLGASLARARGSVQVGRRSATLDAQDFAIRYSEALAVQRFPGDAAAFAAHAKSTVVSLRRGKFAQEAVSAALDDASSAVATTAKRRLKLDALCAVVDADAVGCAIQVADDILAMHAVLKETVLQHEREQQEERDRTTLSSWRASVDGAALLAGAGTSGVELDAIDIVTLSQAMEEAEEGSGCGRDVDRDTPLVRSNAEALVDSIRPRVPMHIDVSALRASLPLSADLELTFEVDAAQVQLAASPHLYQCRTRAAMLSLKGSPIVKWAELSASLHAPPRGSSPLPLQHLHPMSRQKPGERSQPAAARTASLATADWYIHTSPTSSPTAHTSAQRREPDWDPPAPVPLHFTEDPATALPSGLLPYHRAGLHPWLGAAGAAAKSVAAGTSKVGAIAGQAAYLGGGPAAVADVHISKFELTVPHDREPGPTIRYAQMYATALKEAFLHSLKVLRRKPGGGADAGADAPSPVKPKKSAGKRSALFPLELNLRVDGLRFRFEHHPMEKWLAAHGPLLRQAALQTHLWGEAVATAQPAADTGVSPLLSGVVGPASGLQRSGSAAAAAAAAAATAAAAAAAAESGDEPWERLVRDLMKQYRDAVAKAAAAAEAKAAAGGGACFTAGSNALAAAPCEDLLLVGVDSLHVLCVLCDDAAGPGRDSAVSFVGEVDPITASVELATARMLHVDVVAHGPVFSLAGGTQPMVSAERLQIFGPMAIAKQRTAPPTMVRRTLAVGAHRAVPIQVSARGCKAPAKLYTGWEIEAKSLCVCYGPGYEPALGLTGMAGKRLTLSDPDKSAPRPPPVPWWDDLRYLWRGKASITAAPCRVTLAAHQLPAIDDTSERMVVSTAALKLKLRAGEYGFTFRELGCTLFQRAGVESSGGALLALPLLHAPAAHARVRVDWKLPGGRRPDHHHLFPAVGTLSGGLQEPIAVADEFKAEGMDVALDFSFGPGSTGPAAQAAAEAAAGCQLLQQGLMGFLGERQVSFLRAFVRNLRTTPPYVKACVKRGTFFARKPRGAPSKKGLPRLLEVFKLSISAEPFEIGHFTVDMADPSSGVRLGASAASFGAEWLCNQPLPSFLQLPPHIRARQRPSSSSSFPPTRSITRDFALSFAEISMHRDDFDDGDEDDDFLPSSPTGDKYWEAAGARSSPSKSATLTATATAGSEGDMERQGSAATAATAGSSSEAGEEIDTVRGARHAAELLQSLQEQRTALEKDSALLHADSVTVARRPIGDGGGGGGGGGGGDFSPLADALGQGGPARPLKVVVSNCRFLMDLRTRNAVWGAVAHLVAAFSSPPKQQQPGKQRNGPGGGAPTPQLHRNSSVTPGSFRVKRDTPSSLGSLLSPATSISRRDMTAEIQRRLSSHETYRTPSSASEIGGGGSDGNELLSLLLQQREAGGGPDLSTPQASTGEELPGESDEDDEEGESGAEVPMTTPLDDIHSVLRYEVEVCDLQVMIVSSGTGRLLLAAKSGRLRGLSLPDCPTPLQITTLGLEAVQAYTSIADVDPHVSVSWLSAEEGGFSVPPDGGPAMLRRVFNPICIDLRHSKVPSSALTSRRPLTSMGRALSLRSPTPGGGGGGGTIIKSEELVLKIPAIAAVMDGREFEVVADVVALLLTPGPTIETMANAQKLLVESEDEAVEDARAVFAIVRQQLDALRGEALEVRRCVGLQVERSNGTATALGGVRRRGGAELHSFVAAQPSTRRTTSRQPSSAFATPERAQTGVVYAEEDIIEGIPVSTAIREHLFGAETVYSELTAGAGGSGGLDLLATSPFQASARRALTEGSTSQRRRSSVDVRREQLRLLLRWVHEQEAAAAATYTRAKSALLAAKAAAGMQQVSRAASRVLVHVDRIVWQLCSPDKTPFVQAALRGLTFDRHRNRDHSGSAKFSLHRLEIIDATGNLPEGPATPPGVILANWNPDSSYEREPVLRVIVTMGVPTSTHLVFQHLDTTVHPMSLHLTEAIAVACWEYFFPKEDIKARQEAFTQSVASGVVASSRRRGGPSDGGSAGAEAQVLGAQGSHRHNVSGSELPSTPSRAGASSKRIPHAGSSGSLPGEPTAPELGPSSSTTPSATTAAVYMGAFQSQGAAGQPGGGTAAAGDAPVAATAAPGGKAKGVSSPERRQKKRFVYVKLNRAHMRITYQGYPIGIKDRILVINSYTCENLEGRWRDLLANVKQKAILSAVWSGLGLQGRKIRELMDGAMPAVLGGAGATGEDPRQKKGLLAKMGLTSKRREAAPEVELSEEDLKALQKKRALFGDHAVKNLGRQSMHHQQAMPHAQEQAPAPLAAGARGSSVAAAAASSSGSGTSPSAAHRASAGPLSGGSSFTSGRGGGGSGGSADGGSPRTLIDLSGISSAVGGLASPNTSPLRGGALNLTPVKTAAATPPRPSAAAPPAAASRAATAAATAAAGASPFRAHGPVPRLDLGRPLPPEDPVTAAGGGSGDPLAPASGIVGPLQAGLAASVPPAASSSSARGEDRNGSLGSGRSESGGGGAAAAAALLGQERFGGQQEDAAAAALLGYTSPGRQQGLGWLQKVVNKAKGAAGSNGNGRH